MISICISSLLCSCHRDSPAHQDYKASKENQVHQEGGARKAYRALTAAVGHKDYKDKMELRENQESKAQQVDLAQ